MLAMCGWTPARGGGSADSLGSLGFAESLHHPAHRRHVRSELREGLVQRGVGGLLARAHARPSQRPIQVALHELEVRR
jgi:hypothetical protein